MQALLKASSRLDAVHFLGLSWVCLRLSRGSLGLSFGSLELYGDCLGLAWVFFGALLGSLGGLSWPQKTLPLSHGSLIFDFGVFVVPLGALLGSLELSWSLWGCLGLGYLGHLLGSLGPSWGCLGLSWGCLGAVLEPSWGSPGAFLDALGLSWGFSWTHLALS